MILHFKAHTHIYTDKQHFDIKQASMIVYSLRKEKKGANH